MRLEVLGCHGGEVPDLRLPTFLIDGHVVLEAGAVTSALPLEDQTSLEHVLVSHAHLDHTVGLAFLVDNIQAATQRTRPVTAASIAPVIEDLRTFCFNNRLWPDFTAVPPEAPVLALRPLAESQETRVGNVRVIPVPVHHSVPATGFVFHDGTSGFVFSGDTGPTHRLWEVAREIRGVRAVVVETAFPNCLESLAKASGHFTPALLQRELDKMPGVPVWVYHIKPTYYEQTADELSGIDGSVGILQQGRTYEF